QQQYKISVLAHNSYGDSNRVSLTVGVSNIPDVPPKVFNSSFNINENSSPGRVIGKLNFDKGEAPVDSIELTGENKELFMVDKEGTVYVSGELDYEQKNVYFLQYTVTTSLGVSNISACTIKVNNIPEIAPTLKPVTYEAYYHDFHIGVPLGNILVDSGDTAIKSITLSPESPFGVFRDGDIYPKKDFSGKNTEFSLVAVATNDFGQSNEVNVNIKVYAIPVLENTVLSVDENISVGSVIGTVNIISEGMKSVTEFRLSDSSVFGIDNSGRLTLNSKLDYETKTNYTLQVVATNDFGESEPVNVTINIINIPDGEPVLKPAVFSIAEDSKVGNLVGDVEIITSGLSPLTDMRLEGIGAEKFGIDLNGDVTLLQLIDYEQTKSFYLRAIATNAIGKSEAVDVVVDVLNIIDQVPVLKTFTETIDENVTSGTVIGKIEILDKGDSDITVFELSGEGSDHFTIDINGTIRVGSNAVLDYETMNKYVLKAIALNTAGSSDEIDIAINIANIVESKPVLAMPFGNYIDKNVAIGTTVTTIHTNGSNLDENTVDSYSIVSGNTNNVFMITSDGVIQTASALDDQAVSVYTLKIVVHNTAGDSIPVTFVVNVSKEAFRVFQTAQKSSENNVMAISGKYVLAGSSHVDNRGAVYLFKKDENDNLIELEKIMASDGETTDWFGTSVDIDGDFFCCWCYRERLLCRSSLPFSNRCERQRK
ncbi:MAG: cadherin domain-containing protein, partial [Sulfurimonas sp.]